jgi:hypothetical protein
MAAGESIRFACRRLLACLYWLVKSESLEDVSIADSTPAARRRTSFPRWLFSPESLEKDEPITDASRTPSFFSWLMAWERLEKDEPIGDASRTPSFFSWLMARERLDEAIPEPGRRELKHGHGD